jgi:hypothetical protein
VLASARGKRKIEVEAIVAKLAPRPDVASCLRRLAAPKLEPPRPSPSIPLPTVTVCPPVAQGVRVPVTTPLAPLSPDRYKLQVTITGGTLEKLRLAKDLLRHAVPSGDEATILDRALTALLADLRKQKFAETDGSRSTTAAAGRRRPEPGGSSSRHIPAAVKRAVWTRDQGRCAFTAQSGRRCGERAFLEFHHVRPYAVGGESTSGNVELRCRSHNQYEAQRYFTHRQLVPERPALNRAVVRDGPVP